MAYQCLLTDRTNRIGTITLNRPERLNAFEGTMRHELADAVDAMLEDDDVRVLVITGAGRGFCTGGDLAYIADLVERDDVDALLGLVEAGRRIVTAIRRTPKPVIAMVNGVAAGGGANLALACDLRIACDEAKLAESFIRIGMHPDWGGSFFLPRMVGAARALEIMWSGDTIESPDCLRLGLFTKVVPASALRDVTMSTARALAEKPKMAMGLIKQAVYAAFDHTLEEMLAFEQDAQVRCFQSGQAREGIHAFLDKRLAHFTGEHRAVPAPAASGRR